MESFYFSLVLILLGVIVGGVVAAMGFLRGLTLTGLGRGYGPQYGYPPRYDPGLERERSWGWLSGLFFFVLAIFLLNAGKAKLDAWWDKAEVSAIPSPTTKASNDSSTYTLPPVTVDSAQQQATPASAAADSIYVQIGAYTHLNSAESLQQHWLQQGQTARLCIDASSTAVPIYKLWIGPFRDREQAKRFIRQYPGLKGFVP